MQPGALPYNTFIWVELIGFDNDSPDFGVQTYLGRAGFTPDAVSLFVFNPDFVHMHDGVIDDRLLPFDCGSYGGHATGYERERQDWTQAQLLGLTRELQSRGVKVFLSVFDVFASQPWIGQHPEVLAIDRDGVRQPSILPFKRLADGSLYEDFFVRQLAAVTEDYGFDGFHQPDGYCNPRHPLYIADYSADMTEQFVAHSGLDLPDGVGPECGDEPEVVARRAEWVWHDARGEWIRFYTDRMVQFCEKVIAAVHGVGARVVLNNAFTRDPFQALYRYGVDYQRIAAAGADGFILETVAPGVIIGGESGFEANPHHDFQAMVLLMAAALPEQTLWCLNNVHDTNEQWDVLLHRPTLLEREVYCQGSLFRWQADGTLAPCVGGPLVCLGDGIRAHEWEWLRTWWGLGYGARPEGLLGATLVWSDTAHGAQLDDYLATRRLSTHKLLYELMSRGAPVHAVANVEDVSAIRGPLVVLNPHLFPRDELEATATYEHGPVVMIGELPAFLPQPGLRFTDCHEPGALTCAVYGAAPDVELGITDEPEDMPEDANALPDPERYFHELYFRTVSDGFLKACTEVLCEVSGQVSINEGAQSTSVRGLWIAPSTLRLLVGNDAQHYVITQLDLHRPVKSVEVATAFPRKQLPVDGTRIPGLRVPGKGMVILDVELGP